MPAEHRDLNAESVYEYGAARGHLAPAAALRRVRHQGRRSSPPPWRSSATPRWGEWIRRPGTTSPATAGAGSSSRTLDTRGGAAPDPRGGRVASSARAASARAAGTRATRRASTRASCSSRRAGSSTTRTPTTTTSRTSSTSAASGSCVVPYTLVYNDGRFVLPQGFGAPGDFFETCGGARRAAARGRAGYPKMMSIGLHPRWTGQAARAAALRRVHRVRARAGRRLVRAPDRHRRVVARAPRGVRAVSAREDLEPFRYSPIIDAPADPLARRRARRALGRAQRRVLRVRCRRATRTARHGRACPTCATTAGATTATASASGACSRCSTTTASAATVSLNIAVLDHFPEIAEAMVGARLGLHEPRHLQHALPLRHAARGGARARSSDNIDIAAAPHRASELKGMFGPHGEHHADHDGPDGRGRAASTRSTGSSTTSRSRCDVEAGRLGRRAVLVGAQRRAPA